MADSPGVRCPQCGRFLGRLDVGRAEYVCHGFTITVERRSPTSARHAY